MESRPTHILWFLEDIIYVWLYVWIISFRKRGKWEIIELVCFPPASRLIWGRGIQWWGQKWSRTKIYGCDPDLNAFFSPFAGIWKPFVFWCSNCQLVLKLPFKIPQKSYNGLSSLRSFRQKLKRNANKAWDCVFTHSASQKCSKMFKNVQNVQCGA